MGKTRRCQYPCLSVFEIEHMDKSILEKESEILDGNFCQRISKQINDSSDRVGIDNIQVNQVNSPLKLRNNATDITNLPLSSKQSSVPETDASSSHMVLDGKAIIPDSHELEFEARSLRDSAWYDVCMFVAHRTTKGGEVEVKVKYENSGDEENEWVNMKKDIRIRSIPLASSECYKILVGDAVLCYRERDKEALHFDAHVVEIQRKAHDMIDCSCQFLVRYDHDQTEEKVHLVRLNFRPPWASNSMHDCFS